VHCFCLLSGAAPTDEVAVSGDSDPGEVTRLLRGARSGDRDALDRVVPLLYDDLKGLARRQLAREYVGDDAVQPTGLVHEAWMKLASGGSLHAADRPHFMAIAARAMRQVLVDHARQRNAARRGGGWHRTTLAGDFWSASLDPAELIALDAALEALEPRQRQVVECRFFAGMAESEIAAALGVTDRTVRRDWIKARAWLYRALYPDEPPAGVRAVVPPPAAP
jgi:RNA polymerase sigma-70 factor, ECF subfamily